MVFAGDPSPEVRGLLREIYRNMAYRAESGIERNICLAGAQELEDGVKVLPAAGGRNAELAATLSLEDWLDAYAIRLNPSVRGVRPSACCCNCPKAVRWYRSRDKPNSRGSAMRQAGAADVTVTATREALEARMNGQPGEVAIEGDAALFDRWLALHDSFDLWFETATP